MKRWHLLLMMAGVLLLIGWGVHSLSGFSRSKVESITGHSGHVRSGDAMDTPSGWRYRQSQPHHWRYIMLQK
jgi:hypothetical protein